MGPRALHGLPWIGYDARETERELGAREGRDVRRSVFSRVEDESSDGGCAGGSHSGSTGAAGQQARKVAGKPPTMETGLQEAGIYVQIRACVVSNRRDVCDHGM